MSPRGTLYVLGCDAAVGTTTVARALTAALARRGLAPAVMKPVEVGCPPSPEALSSAADREHLASLARLASLAGPAPSAASELPPEHLLPRDALRLLELSGRAAPLELVNPYRFAPALDAAVAARLSGVELSLDHLRCCHASLAAAGLLVVEGSGGPLSPLTPAHLQADLVRELGARALLVASSTPGVISRALLSLEALRQRGITVLGVVLTRHLPEVLAEEAAYPYQLELFAGPIVRGVLPFLSPSQRDDADVLARRLEVHVDVERILALSE